MNRVPHGSWGWHYTGDRTGYRMVTVRIVWVVILVGPVSRVVPGQRPAKRSRFGKRMRGWCWRCQVGIGPAITVIRKSRVPGHFGRCFERSNLLVVVAQSDQNDVERKFDDGERRAPKQRDALARASLGPGAPCRPPRQTSPQEEKERRKKEVPGHLLH
jgi:hypothetical protein